MSDAGRGFAKGSDSYRNYAEGNWGKGQLDAKALAQKYKLDRSQEARGEGHIWGRDASGKEVYIGKSNMGLASNKDLISAHAKQANKNEVDHSGVPEDLSSLGDIKGAILTEWSGGDAAPAAAPEEDTSKPASNTLTKAQSFTEAYDDFRMSGGAVNQMAGDLNARDEFMENYKFNVKKRLEPGVAHETGNDALTAEFQGTNRLASSPDDQRRAKTDSFAQPKVSKIAASIVGKDAGHQSV
jgi:hypothetical protein